VDDFGRFAVLPVVGQNAVLQFPVSPRIFLILLEPGDGLCTAWVCIAVIEAYELRDRLQPVAQDRQNHVACHLLLEIDHHGLKLFQGSNMSCRVLVGQPIENSLLVLAVVVDTVILLRKRSTEFQKLQKRLWLSLMVVTPDIGVLGTSIRANDQKAVQIDEVLEGVILEVKIDARGRSRDGGATENLDIS